MRTKIFEVNLTQDIVCRNRLSLFSAQIPLSGKTNYKKRFPGEQKKMDGGWQMADGRWIYAGNTVTLRDFLRKILL